MKKYIAHPDQKVTIEINRSSKVQSSKPKPPKPKGLMRLRGQEDYLARRLSPSTGIKFWDLGLLDDVSTYHSFIPGANYDATGLDVTYDAINETEKNALCASIENEIFSVPFENWKTRFHKIIPSDIYGAAIYIQYTKDDGSAVSDYLSNLTEFTDGGLKLSETELSTLVVTGAIFLYQYFAFNFTGENSNFKITNVRDISAEAVEFTPSKSMDIFLVPEVVIRDAFVDYRDGFHDYTDGGGGYHFDYITKWEEVRRVYSTVRREDFADLYAALFETDVYLSQYKLFEVLKRMPDFAAKRGVRDFHEFSPYSYFTTWTDISASEFPFSTIYTSSGIVDTNISHKNLGHGVDFYNSQLTGRLAFMILKGGEWFYFWRIV